MAAAAQKPRIFSGIQPTGRKTLGNYSGGFRQYAETQETGEGFFCIVDLHSISVDYDPEELRRSTLDLAAMLFATGLDAERSTVFCQSHVTAHAEAAWLLSSVTSYGQLGRMTQFKEKAEGKEFISAALFTYPVLMAGDILLYQTDLVPIGDDQRQHLELARDVAERFNYRFGETFRVPGGQFPEVGGRIMDLQEPTNKMSTTMSSEQGAVYIADAPDVVRKKFKTAVTDSEREIRYAPNEKPGVSEGTRTCKSSSLRCPASTIVTGLGSNFFFAPRPDVTRQPPRYRATSSRGRWVAESPTRTKLAGLIASIRSSRRASVGQTFTARRA